MEPRTPMMRQYWSIKERHPDAILFFRMGDFFEMFHDDAETAAPVLGLTLTSRSKGEEKPIPLAGVPWHKADHYVDRLLRAGFKVAICDQTEDPKKAKGLVRREVTEVVTPGTALGGALLDRNRPNYLMALAPGRADGAERIGVAAMDVTTGDFRVGELPPEEAEEEVARFEPAELLVPEGERERFDRIGRNGRPPMLSALEDWRFDGEDGDRILREHFGVESLDGFGCSGLPLGLAAAAVLFGYLRDLGRGDLRHVDRVRRIGARTRMVIDETTRRNLELFRPIREGNEKTTLLAVVDGTVTAMGGRLLREWLMRPLLDPEEIGARLGAVEEGVERGALREEARALLRRFGDLERLAGKIVLGRGSPRDLAALRDTLARVPELSALFAEAASPLLRAIANRLEPMEELVRRIGEAIVDEPPASIQEGGIIRDGYSAELDELRTVGSGGKGWMAEFQERERERTGIPSLKVGFNKVFGYYIEISKARAEGAPAEYVRKQTLVNAERYITPELKEQEDRILGAEERIRALEERLFLEVRSGAAAEGNRIRRIGGAAAELDGLLGFAETAVRRGYVRPRVNDGPAIRIRKGRHPVVEALLGPGEFIPNDTDLDAEKEQIHILTGPNMAGKSTYLRQVGLIQILAQAGSFVPAEEAELGTADRVFTRVGASDDLARGQSTFLVEMNETANILHNATPRSLVLLDEIGRGTSTYDGVSIAWAVVEHLHDRPESAAKTLFATHYHELAELADRLDRVRNYSVSVKEWKDRVVFLRRVVPGSVDRSYGIQVARLAGLPEEVIRRAKEVLAGLERDHAPASPPDRRAPSEEDRQLTLFHSPGDRLLEEIRAVDPEGITPLEGLRLLQEWRARFLGEGEA